MVYERRKAHTRLPWDEDEEKLLLQLVDKNLPHKEIVEKHFPRRTIVSVKNKLRKLRKKLRLYDDGHREYKEKVNKRWIEYVFIRKGKRLKILDGYAGVGRSLVSYLQFSESAYACEINKKRFEELIENVLESINGEIVNENHIGVFSIVQIESSGKNVVCIRGDVEKFASLLYVLGHSFDFIDLDPCGSCTFTVPLALKLIRNGYLAVTYGQLQLARLKRMDVLRKECPWIAEGMNMSQTLTSLVKWTVYEGVRVQNYIDTKIVCLKELVSLSKWSQGVIRGLFEVKPSPALADSLNHFDKEKNRVEVLVKALRNGIR